MLEGESLIAFGEESFDCLIVNVEGAEPILRFLEEGVAFQLREGCHIHVCAVHLHLRQFLNTLLHTRFAEPLLPVGVGIFGKVFGSDERFAPQFGVAKHRRDDFLLHLAFYAFGVKASYELQLYVGKHVAEGAVVSKQLQALL